MVASPSPSQQILATPLIYNTVTAVMRGQYFFFFSCLLGGCRIHGRTSGVRPPPASVTAAGRLTFNCTFRTYTCAKLQAKLTLRYTQDSIQLSGWGCRRQPPTGALYSWTALWTPPSDDQTAVPRHPTDNSGSALAPCAHVDCTLHQKVQFGPELD